MLFRQHISAAALSALLLVSGCDTAKDRAEAYFQSGMEYLQAGDVERALVEFRNVFKLDGSHRQARVAYAEAELKRGNVREAYSQYLRLIEQYPDDVAGLKALAQMAAGNAQWEDANSFIASALALTPDDVALQSLRIYTDYGVAVESNDAGAVVSSVKAANDLRQKAPAELLLHKVIVDDLIRAQSFEKALTELDAAIKIAPTERLLYAQRLSIFAALGDDAAVETGLIDMVAKFPDSPEMHEALLRWYLSRKDYDKAEAYLRAQAAIPTEETTALIELIRFLGEFRGPDAAIAELDKAIAAGKSVPVFRSARAGFRFDRGDREGAVAEMEEILKTAEAGEETRTIKIGLARMQLAVGNSVAARALVEEVLVEDSGQTEALKLKASWLIQDDEVGDAVSILRDAIDQNPRDAGLMTLMAQAYERDGNRELMREMLSQAVEASGRAPAESLRYAQLLASENNLIAAEGIIIDSLRITPGDTSLLVPLGQIYVGLNDWSRADAVAKDLEALNDDRVKNDLTAIRAAILEGEKKTGEAISYLEQAASAEGAQLDAKMAVLRNHLDNGRLTEASAFAAQMLASDPENLDLQYINATVQAMTGKVADSEVTYRAILAKDKTRATVWLSLFRALSVDPARQDEAAKLLDEALAAVPDSGELRWAKAGMLETSGDIDGAITLYESLYKENSANPIVANNLASLLSNYRKDSDSLARAEVIARRLRGSDLPPYQDTFGWIAYQNNNFPEALAELEKAAVGLPDDPTVQYHLAMTYLALSRAKDAAAQFTKVIGMLPADDSREIAVSTRSELEKLKAAGVAE